MTERPYRLVEYLTRLLHATELPYTPVELPRAKRTVEVLTILRREQSWPGPVPASFCSVPNKPPAKNKCRNFAGHRGIAATPCPIHHCPNASTIPLVARRGRVCGKEMSAIGVDKA